MIWHPMLLSVLILMFLTLLLWSWASEGFIRVTLFWSPSSSRSSQLTLERRAEAASLAARLAIFVVSWAMLAWLISLVSMLQVRFPVRCAEQVFCKP